MGKKWKNAPVMYTVAQVRFNQILTMESYVPAIQDKLRIIGFPDFRKEVINVLGFQLGQVASNAPSIQTVNRYAFSNLERTAGFLLESNALSFQATDYDTFEKFSECLSEVLKIVNDSISIGFVERVGIRYLDAVIPKVGECLKDYLVPQVLGLTYNTTHQLSHSYTETVSTHSEGGLISRVIIQNGEVSLPPELAQTAYTLNSRFTNVTGLHAVIDTDGYFEKRIPFDLDLITKKLDEMHNDIVAAFKCAASEHALKVWEFGL